MPVGTTFTAGQTDYIPDLNGIIVFVDGLETEIITARGGESTLNDRLNGFLAATWTQNVNAGGYRLTNGADGINPQDFTTLSQVNAIVGAGGSPSLIAITSLNVGTATANQLIGVNGAGTDIIGLSAAALAVTDLDVGTATAGQNLKINDAGTAVVGSDDKGFFQWLWGV